MRRWWLCLALLCGIGWLNAASVPVWAQRPGLATLISFATATNVQRSLGGPTVTPVRRGMSLDPGYVIQTDAQGRAESLFRDGRQVKVDINTTLEFSPTKSDHIRIVRGNVWVRIPPRAPMWIDGIAASCHPHGTELEMAVADDGTTTLTVVEGDVEFANAQGRVMVKESQQSTARPGQAPSPPVAAVNLPSVIQWTNDVQPVALLLETSFVSQDPDRLAAALRETEGLPTGEERSRRLGDVRHDRGELQEALMAYQAARTALGPQAPAGAAATLAARIGQTLLEQGKVAEAQAEFRQSLDLNPGETAARVGLVMTLLSRRQEGDLAQALTEAQEGVARDAASPVAHTALALVEIRSGEREKAQQELDQAQALDAGYAQVEAWLSFLLRAAERLPEASQAAQRAVALAPYSSLARQSLADAEFALGQDREARAEAERAVALNPLSPGARVSLARALLQQGEIDRAVQEGSKAVALDPDLDRAHFLLGLALWEQRRLDRAEQELNRAIVLDPGYLEARAYLARVYLEEGRRAQAREVARQAVARNPNFAPVRAALGRVDYSAGQLPEAANEYRAALALAPGSLLYHLELARVYLDEYHLPDALSQALEAVHVGTTSGEAHAVLGLVYERQNNNEQALREYREAVGLAPDNALARIGLALQSPNAIDAFAEFSQALLRDPSVTEQEFKPGVTTELSGSVGSQDQYGLGFKHRDQYADGKVYDFSLGAHNDDGGWRGNDSATTNQVNINLAARPTPQLNTLYQLVHFAEYLGEPGTKFQPDRDVRYRTSLLTNALAGRYSPTSRTAIWLQAAYESLHQGDRNPAGPADGNLRLRDDVLDGTSRFEARLDQRLGRSATFTSGYFTANDAARDQLLSWNEFSQSAMLDTSSLRFRDDVAYFQLDHRTRRFVLIAGEQHARSVDSVSSQGLSESTRDGRWLPYVEGSLQLAPRTLLRLIGNERATRLTSAGLLPTEAFIIGEPVSATFGGRVKTLEMDLEHRFSARLFTKLFLFRSDVRDLLIQEPVEVSKPNGGFTVPRVREEGLGLRMERQLTPFLAGYLRYTASSATDQDLGPTHGWQLPQNPHSSAVLGLNFVDRAGTKAFLELPYTSPVFSEALWSDTEGFDPLAPRPRESPHLLVNLRVGQERSVRFEWSVRLDNLFNHTYALWPGVPGRGRAVVAQLQRRF